MRKKTSYLCLGGYLLSIAFVQSGFSQEGPASSSLKTALPFSKAEAKCVEKPTALETVIQLVKKRKSSEFYPDVPRLKTIRLPLASPLFSEDTQSDLSPGLTDPILEEARNRSVFDDFKILSDARPRPLSPDERESVKRKAIQAEQLGGRNAYLRTWIEGLYVFGNELYPAEGIVKPQWRVKTEDRAWSDAFDYVEETWPHLVRKTPLHSFGSLLPSPYPILIPAGRFQELYYWDTYFGVKGLLATRRLELAQMEAENLLYFVQRYGFIPNGGRDYYLSRSQPPVLSTLIREVYEASIQNTSPDEALRVKNWLKQRAYPLVKRDYLQFWMNPLTRYDAKTGLNHHWDEINLPRPERHSFDNEQALGLCYRDVRAAAESGLDFTLTLGFEASQTAGVLLNSLMYKTEQDLLWMARLIELPQDESQFKLAAENRRKAVTQYLWNPKSRRFDNYSLKDRKRIEVLSADTFVPLFAQLATPQQAQDIVQSLKTLEKPCGMMSSELIQSPNQWDGLNGWAPQQVFAIQGLLNYGYNQDAIRLARRWVDGVAQSYKLDGALFERTNVATCSKPAVDQNKYPTQTGFLWTNGSYVWALTQVLGVKMESRPTDYELRKFLMPGKAVLGMVRPSEL